MRTVVLVLFMIQLMITACSAAVTAQPATTAAQSASATSVPPTPNPTPTPPDSSIDGSGTLLEFQIKAEAAPQEIPKDLADFYGKENYKWVVVTFEVLSGELDMQEMWFESRVETSSRYYDIDRATIDLRLGVQARGAIKEGSSGIALYQVPENETTFTWNLENLTPTVSAREK